MSQQKSVQLIQKLQVVLLYIMNLQLILFKIRGPLLFGAANPDKLAKTYNKSSVQVK